MDPYVLGVIRLAERRGRLTGDLSPVQEWMLRTLMLFENVEADQVRFDQRYTALRAALVSSSLLADFDSVMKLFPEFFENTEVVVDRITEDELLDTTGTWSFEKSVTTPQEIEQVLRAMGEHGRVSLREANGDHPWL